MVIPAAAMEESEIPTLDVVEREHIKQVLKVSGGQVSGEKGAARLLGIKPTTLESRMIKFGISKTPMIPSRYFVSLPKYRDIRRISPVIISSSLVLSKLKTLIRTAS